MRLNPLALIAIYLPLHVIVIAWLMKTYDHGGASFEILVNSFTYLAYGILACTVIGVSFNTKWAKRYWFATLLLLGIGVLPFIFYWVSREGYQLLPKMAYKWDNL